MPKTIKPKLSKDQLGSFDARIDSIYYEDGFLSVNTSGRHTGEPVDINFDEHDLEILLRFIKTNNGRD